MALTTFHSIFLVLFVFTLGMRSYFAFKNRSSTITAAKAQSKERIILNIARIGIVIPPFIFLFTSWFNSATFTLPLSIQIVGLVGLLIAALTNFWTHHTLRHNWSPTLEIKSDQTLIMTGPYKYVRHPMYSAIWLWVIVQGIVLTNGFVIVISIASFATLYFLRINDEEKMMTEQFGKQYEEYMTTVGRIIPFVK